MKHIEKKPTNLLSEACPVNPIGIGNPSAVIADIEKGVRKIAVHMEDLRSTRESDWFGYVVR